jgi:hypothetical protein
MPANISLESVMDVFSFILLAYYHKKPAPLGDYPCFAVIQLYTPGAFRHCRAGRFLA